MKFSERIGKTTPRKLMQTESIDERLLNRLWNFMFEEFFWGDQLYDDDNYQEERDSKARKLWKDFFHFRINQLPTNSWNILVFHVFATKLHDWVFTAQWFQVYDLMEFMVLHFEADHKGVIGKFNTILKEEMSGYRFIGNQLTSIVSEMEIREIEEALTNSDKWTSVNTHLQHGLNLLSDRAAPDFRNSIKESISAVEALCKIVAGDDKVTLGQALNKLERTMTIPGSLQAGFKALYGYTSDAGGIRHSLTENDTNVGLNEARFMLIACSAFINYLKAGIPASM